jgi:ribose transport system substrate-binding protein
MKTMISRVLPAGVAAASVLLALSGCGSGGGGNAATTGSTPNQGASANVAAAQANTSKYSQQPTDIGITTPLAKRPTGKTVDFVQCGLGPCQEVGDDLVQPLKMLGITLKRIPAGLTPESYKAGFDQAVQDRPAGVISTAISTSTVSSEISQLEAMKIPTVITAVSGTSSSPLLALPFGDAVSTLIGKIGADMIIQAGGGKNIQVADLTFPVFDFEGPQLTGFQGQFTDHCTNCKIHQIVSQPTDIGQAVDTKTVSALQANSNIKYVWGSFGSALTGVSQALKVAGVSGVSQFSQGGTADNLADIKAGTENATIVVSFPYLSWVAANDMAQLLTGGSISGINDASLPWFYIVNKSNLNFDITKNPEGPGPVNFQAQFEKLWGLPSS